MARKSPKKVGRVEVEELGVSADIMLDPDRLIFMAEVAGTSYSAKSVEELRPAVEEALREGVSVEWIPVIMVVTLEAGSFLSKEGDFIGYRVERIYCAKRNSGQWMFTRWDIDPAERLSKNWVLRLYRVVNKAGGGEFDLPCSDNVSGGPIHYLPYSEETWGDLQKAIEAIGHLSAYFDMIFRKPDHYQADLATVGERLTALILPHPQTDVAPVPGTGETSP